MKNTCFSENGGADDFAIKKDTVLYWDDLLNTVQTEIKHLEESSPPSMAETLNRYDFLRILYVLDQVIRIARQGSCEGKKSEP